MGAKVSSFKKELSEKDLAYFTQHTGLQKEQVLDYYDKFKKSGDPLKSPIDQTEFLGIMQICYPRTYHQDLAKDIFRLYDRDGNGSIMFEEFLMMIYVMSDGSKEQKLEQIFRIFDCDGSGWISEEEVEQVAQHLFHLLPDHQKDSGPEKVGAALMQEMDMDKNGQVTREEFVKAFLRQESFTTLLVNKMMMRAVVAQTSILKE